MKKIASLLLFIAIAFNARSQYVQTDYINLGEDDSTHSYMQYGAVSIGAYVCGTDQSIRVGHGNAGDSITFDMAVLPGTDSVLFEIKLPWANPPYPAMVIDGQVLTTIPSNILGCDSSTTIVGGLSALTGDGIITIKIMDTISSFSMDAQITYMKVFSNQNPTQLQVLKRKTSINIYPVPGNDFITFSNLYSLTDNIITIFNTLGEDLFTERIQGDKVVISTSQMPAGIYFSTIGHEKIKFIILH